MDNYVYELLLRQTKRWYPNKPIKWIVDKDDITEIKLEDIFNDIKQESESISLLVSQLESLLSEVK